jgi:hypothetical protein
MTLREVLEAAAAELDTVETVATDEGVEWRHAGRVFAVAGTDAAQFRLDPLVVKAALRTPGTAPSERGPDWVAFAPVDLEGPALDRATAWLASGRRRAESS